LVFPRPHSTYYIYPLDFKQLRGFRLTGISVKGRIGIKAAIRAIKQLELFPFIIANSWVGLQS